MLKQWFETNVECKKNKVVVKLKNKDGKYRNVIIPSVLYPLNKSTYEVFSYNNTEAISDAQILKIFDSVNYKMGHCYQNTKELVAKLQAANYDAKTYVGWLFVNDSDVPVHHCWCVVDGKHVLDLSDDFTVMLSGSNGENFKNLNKKETLEMMIDFHKAASNHLNSVRCAKVGKPTNFLLYIGCPCDADEGRNLYNELIKKYPNHECNSNCDELGYNATQKALKNNGLM